MCVSLIEKDMTLEFLREERITHGSACAANGNHSEVESRNHDAGARVEDLEESRKHDAGAHFVLKSKGEFYYCWHKTPTNTLAQSRDSS